MERFVAVVKQYPGQQQVDLAVEIEVPGSWFGAGPMGSLTATEQREPYQHEVALPYQHEVALPEEEEDLHEDDDDEEGMLDADEDEEQVQANEAANKKFPLAHRLLDDVGFKNNSYLESTLFSANEVSGLVQKQEGMGLSMGYQMAKVLKDDATGMKLMVVSGTTKEGDWKETHAAALPNMFKVQRRIFA